MGKSLTEFKKGMQGIDEDVRGSYQEATDNISYDDTYDDKTEPSAPAFEPPKAEETSS